MGLSPWHNLPFCIDALLQMAPLRMLDLRIGFGRWGILAHEFCAGWLAQATAEPGQVYVAGIAGSAGQVADHQTAFYDRIYIGDAGTLAGHLPGPWDLIICDGLLNALDKEAGRHLLSACVANSAYVLVNVALGPGGARDGAQDERRQEANSLW